MGCYSRWDTYLDPDSPEYEVALSELGAKFIAMKHVVDYYFAEARMKLPLVEYEGSESNYRLVEPLKTEASLMPVIDAIAHHLSCDGADGSTLFDVDSTLNKDDSEICSYGYVLTRCAVLLRSR